MGWRLRPCQKAIRQQAAASTKTAMQSVGVISPPTITPQESGTFGGSALRPGTTAAALGAQCWPTLKSGSPQPAVDCLSLGRLMRMRWAAAVSSALAPQSERKRTFMKKAKPADDEMRAEFRREDLGPLVRGKFAARYAKASNVVAIDPVLTKLSANSEAVNDALRSLVSIASKVTGINSRPSRTPRKRATS